ncbi:putative protein E8 [Bos taurus papillomavirus 3]|uniref:Uncharacterized protein E8 n=1 Tax=Bovine papillomavirus type 3 TaxID=2758957 RepID=VE8_BPV3|nr:putative protein E8 [Xipapillomavirus 1]Q8BDD9.1 RecName: Full=Uncharacterized protein E8 [Bos taurus papillomavirus 3]AAN09955.1 putative protein E8 [Bos taurus papillomavirus 3]QYI89601.1 E8 early protein [Bos taurus papillomavirus 3]CAF05677.1 E8 protein [Xipapillomavirus 1]
MLLLAPDSVAPFEVHIKGCSSLSLHGPLGSICIMSLTLIYWLLLLWVSFHFLSLCLAIILYLLLMSTITSLHGWD